MITMTRGYMDHPNSRPRGHSADRAPARGMWGVVGAVASLLVTACTAPSPTPSLAANALSVAVVGEPGDYDVLTQHNNPQRTGASLHEIELSPENIRTRGMRRLFEWRVDGQIYTQPLYVSNIRYQGRTLSIVIVGTTNNSVYAFEAPASGSPQQPSEEPLWRVANDELGAPLAYYFTSMKFGWLRHNMKPKVGITATPVVDRERHRVYVTVKSGTGGFLGFAPTVSHHLVAIDLLTGRVVTSQEICVGEQVPGCEAEWFKPALQLQRASLLEANNRIYLGFGSHQDTLPFHGWLLAYDADSLQRVGAFCTTCNGTMSPSDGNPLDMGAIWQAGGGLVADPDGNIFAISGNGAYDPSVRNLGTSFMKLDRDLNFIGSWTPVHWKCLNRTDADLGSAGPMLLAGPPSTLLGGGKEGVLYAIDASGLSGIQSGLARTAAPAPPCKATDPVPTASGPGYSSIQASPLWQPTLRMDVAGSFDETALSWGYHHIHGSPVAWRVHGRTLVYVSAERDVLRAFAFEAGKPARFPDGAGPGEAPTDTFHSASPNSDKGMPGGFLTLSANGDVAASGVVWAVMPRPGDDAYTDNVPGVLRAYEAYPGLSPTLDELWNSDAGTHLHRPCEEDGSCGKARLGRFAKFVPPTVADGKVYVATFSGHVAVYGLGR